ncbi:MAG: 2-C-methyl-D-erythritol 4-phosphate cytidylyltransferase [Oscillospiraceae bacterium]|nr:2-C-methyl-D-erythritol 4-phosphate cytidylyltransferase [Oscillospiraceae bacterium]
MIFGAILAGGTGTRMNLTTMPKQFLPLGDKPILIHTIARYLKCEKIDAVIVGVHADWVEYTNGLLEQYLPGAKNRVKVITGGTDRTDTMLRLLNAIEQTYGASNEHIVLTHDGVRPFFTQRMLEENIAAVYEYGAVNTVSPAIDTIVVSEDGKTISSVPNRATMFLGQCPQTFRVSQLKAVYNSLTEEERKTLTEATKIYTMRGLPVYLVQGAASNIKITTPADYTMAQAIAEDFED